MFFLHIIDEIHLASAGAPEHRRFWETACEYQAI